MNRLLFLEAMVCLVLAFVITGCERKVTAQENAVAGTGPVPTAVQLDMDSNNFKVEHSDRFPLATASEHVAAAELNVTGVVNPDVSRQVPVPSLATGVL